MSAQSSSLPLDSRPSGLSAVPNEAAGKATRGRLSVSAWLAGMPPRNRMMVSVAALVLGVLALYALAIRPALSTMREAPARMAALDAELQTMRALAAESQELRGAPKLPPAQAGAALKSATDALGSVARLSVLGDRATVTFTQASGEQVRRWLVDARASARAKPVEATLTRSTAGLSGSVVVALPAP